MIAFKNIFRRRLRSLLTLIGIAVGLSVYVTLSSISLSLKSEIQGIMLKYDIDVIVQPKSADPFIASRIPVEDFQRLNRLEGIRSAYPLVTGSMKTPWSPHFFILGIASVEAISGRFSLTEGQLFSHGKKEILLGSVIAGEYGYKPGNKIVLTENEIYTITGIYHFGNRIADGAAILSIENAQRILKRGNLINMVFINVSEGTNIDSFIAVVNRDYPELLAMRSASLARESHLMNTLDFFVWVMTGISFITCCIIIMNTLFMNVTERTREIGILMAIGWSRTMIFRTILLEAVMICIAGGIAGIALSKLTLIILGKQHIMSSSMLSSYISAATAAKAMIFSILLGIAGSAFPAFFAARMLPAAALRFEQ